MEKKENKLLEEIICSLIKLNDGEPQDIISTIYQFDLITRTHDIYSLAHESNRTTQVNALYLLIILYIKIDRFSEAVEFSKQLQQLNNQYQLIELSYIFNHKILEIKVEEAAFRSLQEQIPFTGMCCKFRLLNGFFQYSEDEKTQVCKFVSLIPPEELKPSKAVSSSLDYSPIIDKYSLNELIVDLKRSLQMRFNYLPEIIPPKIIDKEKLSQAITTMMFSRTVEGGKHLWKSWPTIKFIASILPNYRWIEECMILTKNGYIMNSYYLAILQIPDCNKNAVALAILKNMNEAFHDSTSSDTSYYKHWYHFEKLICPQLISALTEICSPREFISQDSVKEIALSLKSMNCRQVKPLAKIIGYNVIRFYFIEKKFAECLSYLEEFKELIEPSPLMSTCCSFLQIYKSNISQIVCDKSLLLELVQISKKLDTLITNLYNSHKNELKLPSSVLGALKENTTNYLQEIRDLNLFSENEASLDAVTYSMLRITYILKELKVVENTEIPLLPAQTIDKITSIYNNNKNINHSKFQLRFRHSKDTSPISLANFTDFLKECTLTESSTLGI